MPFRLTKSSREWFRHLLDSFEVAFDVYYIGAVVGMLEGRKSTVHASDAPELVDDFPELYRSSGNVLIGMLMAAELRAVGSPLRDKKLVQRVVGELVDLRSHSRLSEQGIAALNDYA